MVSRGSPGAQGWLGERTRALQVSSFRSAGREGTSMKGIKQVQSSQLHSPPQEDHPEPGTRFTELQWGKATFLHRESCEHW